MPTFTPHQRTTTQHASGEKTDLTISNLITTYTSAQIASKNFVTFALPASSSLVITGKVLPILSPPATTVLQPANDQQLTVNGSESELIEGNLEHYVQGNLFQQIGRNHKVMVGGQLSGTGGAGLEQQLWEQQTSHNYDQVKVSYFVPNSTSANNSQARTTFQNHTLIQWGNRTETRYVNSLRRTVGNSVARTEGNEQDTITGRNTSEQWSGQNVTLINGANIEVYAGMKNILNTGLTWNLYPLAPTFIFHLVLGIIQLIGSGVAVAKLKNKTLELKNRLVSLQGWVLRVGSVLVTNIADGVRIGTPRI